MAILRIEKHCNAFIPDAEIADDNPIIRRAKNAFDRSKKKHGGLWVGGTVLITDDGIAFAPKGIYIDLLRDPSTVLIPRQKIKNVGGEFGWLTGIVIVTHTDGQFRFRCFGAKSVAERFSAALAIGQFDGWHGSD